VILPIIDAFMVSKLLITLMGFSRPGNVFFIQTPHEHTWSKLYDMYHGCDVVTLCRPLNSGLLKICLQLTWHWLIRGSINSRNYKQMAVCKLDSIKNFLQMWHLPCFITLAMNRSCWISFRNGNKTGNQPHQKPVWVYPLPK
jgi:hypothetical protein